MIVASLVLVVGMLGVLTLLTGALRTTTANSERVAATNLARELVEETRGLRLRGHGRPLVPPAAGARVRLRARPGRSAPQRDVHDHRDVVHVRRPADKLAAPAPDGVCTPQPAGIGGDSNGEDFRRMTFRVSWSGAAGPPALSSRRRSSATRRAASARGSLSFTPVAQTITASVSSVIVDWTTTAAQSLRWTVDDGASAGSS